MNRNILIASLAALVAMMSWSSSYTIGRAYFEYIQPVEAGFIRWVMASMLVLPFAWCELREKPQELRHALPKLAIAGFFGVSLFQVFTYIGIQETTATNSNLLNAVTPLAVIAIAWPLLREEPTWRQWLAIVIATVGILILISEGRFDKLSNLEFNAGDLWILASIMTWGIYSAVVKWAGDGLGVWAQLFLIFSTGTVFLGLMYPIELIYFETLPNSQGQWIVMVSGAFLGSLLAYICYNTTIQRIGATKASYFFYLAPIVGVLQASVFLGERLFSYHWVGFSVIFMGIIVAIAPRRHSRNRARRDGI